MRVLMVLTSHDQLGDSGNKTGFWLDEFAAPFYTLADAGATIILASPAGGLPPIDPNSEAESAQTDLTQRFKVDAEAQAALANTHKLSTINPADYDAVFYPGGHGPLWDLAEDPVSIKLIEDFWQAGKPVAAVCHAPGVLKQVRDGDQPLVAKRRVTGFSNTEEDAVGLTNVVPFLVEDMLKENGGHYMKGDDWTSFVQVDGRLISGQNPASSAATAQALLEQLSA